MTLIKSSENIFKYNSHRSLDVTKVKQLLSPKHDTSYRIHQFWAIF